MTTFEHAHWTELIQSQRWMAQESDHPESKIKSLQNTKTSPSKIQTLLSRLHVARYAPLTDQATHFTSFS